MKCNYSPHTCPVKNILPPERSLRRVEVVLSFKNRKAQFPLELELDDDDYDVGSRSTGGLLMHAGGDHAVYDDLGRGTA